VGKTKARYSLSNGSASAVHPKCVCGRITDSLNALYTGPFLLCILDELSKNGLGKIGSNGDNALDFLLCSVQMKTILSIPVLSSSNHANFTYIRG
jgi:hypothetical protein